MRQAVKHTLRYLTAPFLAHIPIRSWPAITGRIHDLSVPKGVVPHSRPEPRGAANINILLEFLDRTAKIAGAVAECGVFRGGTLVSMGVYLKQQKIDKPIYGFDSFEGFGDTIEYDQGLQVKEVDPNMTPEGFSDTSYELVDRKRNLFGLSSIRLVRGFFDASLETCKEKLFSFVHLDCDSYGSYSVCLRYFYPRMAEGGIISFDEYNDPPWPGCNQAVDEFLKDKPEQLQEITRENHMKYYFVVGRKA